MTGVQTCALPICPQRTGLRALGRFGQSALGATRSTSAGVLLFLGCFAFDTTGFAGAGAARSLHQIVAELRAAFFGEGEQRCHFGRVRGGDVLGFADVVAQVVELGRRDVATFVLGRNAVLAAWAAGERAIIVRELDRKSTRLNSSHVSESRMPSSA